MAVNPTSLKFLLFNVNTYDTWNIEIGCIIEMSKEIEKPQYNFYFIVIIILYIFYIFCSLT